MIDDLIRAFNALDMPTVVLLFILIVGWQAAASAQERGIFDWRDAFRDESGKVSWTRTSLIAALALSSWVLVYVFTNAIKSTFDAAEMVRVLDALFWYFAGWSILWALGPKFMEKALNALIAKWSGTTITTTETPVAQPKPPGPVEKVVEVHQPPGQA